MGRQRCTVPLPPTHFMRPCSCKKPFTSGSTLSSPAQHEIKTRSTCQGALPLTIPALLGGPASQATSDRMDTAQPPPPHITAPRTRIDAELEPGAADL